MKNIIKFLSLAFVFTCVSCEDVNLPYEEVPDVELQEGEYIKTVNISLDCEEDSLETKVYTNYIQKAQYFVYRSVDGGNYTYYGQTGSGGSGGSSQKMPFLFSDQHVYTYKVIVYCNFNNDFTSPPSDSEVLLKNHYISATLPNLQRIGSYEGITKDNTTVSIPVTRLPCVLRINQIYLHLPGNYNLGEVTLDRVFLANVSGDYAKTTKLNTDGTHTATDCEVICWDANSWKLRGTNYFRWSSGGILACYDTSVQLVVQMTCNGTVRYFKFFIDGLSPTTNKSINLNISQW